MKSIIEAINKLCQEITERYTYDDSESAAAQNARAQAVFRLVMASRFMSDEMRTENEETEG